MQTIVYIGFFFTMLVNIICEV